MLNGLDIFRKKFKDFRNEYVFIGGAACELLMSETQFDFRATRDIDMVLVVEALTTSFVSQFWEFVKEGGYECWCRKD